MAGSYMTASPSQLVARTQSRDTAEGLKATAFQDSSGLRAAPDAKAADATALLRDIASRESGLGTDQLGGELGGGAQTRTADLRIMRPSL